MWVFIDDISQFSEKRMKDEATSTSAVSISFVKDEICVTMKIS